MKSCRASAGRPANDSEDCSAGQPANRSPDNNAQQPDHYCNMYHSKAKAPLPPQYCAVCNQACRHPFGPVRRPADEVLVPTCGISCYQKRWQLQGLTIGYASCEDASTVTILIIGRVSWNQLSVRVRKQRDSVQHCLHSRCRHDQRSV